MLSAFININTYLGFVYFSEKYSRNDIPFEVPPWQIKVGILIKLNIFCALVNAAGALLYFFKIPEENVFLSSLIFPEHMLLQRPRSWWVLIIGGLVNTWVWLWAWSIVILWSATYMIATYAVIFILQELK